MTDWDEHTPIYLQLRSMVLQRIISGSLQEGEPVPSVRQVAAEEKINPLTVSKAYQILVDEGLLEKHRGVGMYVSKGARSAALAQEREAFLTQAWPQIKQQIETLGLSIEQLLLGDK